MIRFDVCVDWHLDFTLLVEASFVKVAAEARLATFGFRGSGRAQIGLIGDNGLIERRPRIRLSPRNQNPDRAPSHSPYDCSNPNERTEIAQQRN